MGVVPAEAGESTSEVQIKSTLLRRGMGVYTTPMDITQALSEGSAQAWLYIPTAIVIGALHGLEPGHSKTMMAAFIIAVKGTVTQAALLGLSAALSHSLVIWFLAALALKFGNQWNVESTEPYFLMATGVIVAAMAIWTLWRLQKGAGHHHHHHDETQRIDFAGGWIEIGIFEEGVPPRFRIATSGINITPVSLRTIRIEGGGESYVLLQRDGFWESQEEIPEPHEFKLEFEAIGDGEPVTGSAEFHEHHHHGDEDEDAHAREHAEQIKRRFDGRTVTTPQIILFGLTGGLIPCPAALSILLICLHFKKFTLGFSMVAAFSIGLALTLVTVGVVAAWGMRKATQHSGTLSRLAGKAPYASSILLILLGIVFFVRGIWSLG